MYQLTIENGRQAGQCVRPRTTEFTIGRDQGNHLRLPEDGVSGHHCVLRVRRNGITIRDLGSTNGTYVNEQFIREETRLPGGASIELGAVRLRFDFVHDTHKRKRRITGMFWVAVAVVAATFALQFIALGVAVWMRAHTFSPDEIIAIQRWFPPLPQEELDDAISAGMSRSKGRQPEPATPAPEATQPVAPNR
ncbi:MAG: FHA domain-containing protein [Verrucomicrobia bacterium]|nr:FHA domain-containing protein [Verrucomicrobiota bacterium]